MQTKQLTLDGVGRTAFGTAYLRALESRRPDRLFDDQLAHAFLDAAAPGLLRQVPGDRTDNLTEFMEANRRGLMFAPILKTRFFDDYLLAAAAGGCVQLVILGAGFDTRAYRLPLSVPVPVRVFELDIPEVAAFKDSVLEECRATPNCIRTVVPADLRTDWVATLIAHGFDTSAPATWLAEGLLSYLTGCEVVDLLSNITALAARGSRVGFEDAGNFAEHVKADPGLAKYVPLVVSECGSASRAWLASHGWSVDTHDCSALAASYGRCEPGPYGRLVTALRTGV
jgi:methyltransferase (TIGR00027 family)